MSEGRGTNYGKFCVFLSRSCGTVASIIVLLCGFITLIPLPTSLVGSLWRCFVVGIVMIVTAVVMFFLESSVLGYCVERLAFLLIINKYLQPWMRAVLYMGLAFVPVILWCLSASTIIGLGVTFLIGALNFILAVGQKGEHEEVYKQMRFSELITQEEETEEEEASGDEEQSRLKNSQV